MRDHGLSGLQPGRCGRVSSSGAARQMSVIESLRAISPSRQSYMAAVRALDGMPVEQRPGHVDALTEAVEDWPAHTRNFALTTQRDTLRANSGLLASIGRLELAVTSSGDAAMAVRVLSMLPWQDLQHVHFHFFPGGRIDVAALLDALPETVDGLTIGGNGARFHAPSLLEHPRWLGLRHLVVDGLMGDELRALVLGAARLPLLETLWLPVGAWGPAEVAQLVARPELQSLERLAFRCFLPEDDDERRLADALQRLERLHTVAVVRYWASTPGHRWIPVPEPLPTLLSRPSLKALHYEHGATPTQRLRELLTSAAPLSRLSLHDDQRVADLGWTDTAALAELEALAVTAAPLIGDDAAQQLAGVGLSKLRRLDLHDDDIGEPGARALLDSLEAGLEHLDLSGNPLGDGVVDAIVSQSSLLERVVSLHLERCQLGAGALGQLLEAVSSQAPRIATVRVAVGNEVDEACAAQLAVLQRRGVAIDALPNPRVVPHPADAPRSYRPSLRAAGLDGAADVAETWQSIDTSVQTLLDGLDGPPFTPAKASEVDGAVDALHQRWAALGLRVPGALLETWRRYDGGDALLFEVFEDRYRTWYGPRRATQELLSMLDIDVGWQVSWLPVAEGGLYVDVRTGEVREWDRGNDRGRGLDWGALLETVAAKVRSVGT